MWSSIWVGDGVCATVVWYSTQNKTVPLHQRNVQNFSWLKHFGTICKTAIYLTVAVSCLWLCDFRYDARAMPKAQFSNYIFHLAGIVASGQESLPEWAHRAEPEGACAECLGLAINVWWARARLLVRLKPFLFHSA